MSEFTKERLREIAVFAHLGSSPVNIRHLAEFALGQVKRAATAKAKLIDCGKELSRALGHLSETEAERDRLKKELEEAEEAIRSAESIIGNSGVNRDVKGAFGERPAVLRARERAK